MSDVQPEVINVTLHQQEPYIIRFEHTEHAALASRCFTGGGIDIYQQPWRNLSHTLSFLIFYRV
jgi:hypothetical protein